MAAGLYANKEKVEGQLEPMPMAYSTFASVASDHRLVSSKSPIVRLRKSITVLSQQENSMIGNFSDIYNHLQKLYSIAVRNQVPAPREEEESAT